MWYLDKLRAVALMGAEGVAPETVEHRSHPYPRDSATQCPATPQCRGLGPRLP